VRERASERRGVRQIGKIWKSVKTRNKNKTRAAEGDSLDSEGKGENRKTIKQHPNATFVTSALESGHFAS
jgi:hypothetical protein